ncbi:MAG TPA: Uma2 family endonuclease [Thermoanaerobaculia bacterium]|nr:Uma2 family endonuclease [Thermoanaerobaculia bacterium]
MAVDPIPRKLTYEDYLLFPEEDGLRHELIDGEHFVSPAPSRKHQKASWNLAVFIGSYLRENPLGEAYTAPFDVVLSRHDVVQPDLIFVSDERLAILGDKNAQGSPDLVIEILSTGTRKVDETLKLRLYERSGAREYWMLDPEGETARVYRREGDGFSLARDASASSGDELETPLLPGLRIPLADLFR